MKGFNTKMQAVCTCWCILALFLAAIATILVHVAFGVLITPLVELPANLRTGIDDALKFSHLETGAVSVKNHAQAALNKCSVNTVQCGNLPTPGFNQTSDSSTELNGIVTIFDDTLAVIQKVASDKFLGQGDFKIIANDLEVMRSNLTSLKNYQQPIQCRATNQMYCDIYTAGNDIVTSMATVKSGIDKLTNSPAILEYEENAARASGAFNGLPYLMWVCVLFYGCFWFSNRPSCKGGCAVCMACCCHALFFVLALVISLVFVAGGIVMTKVVAELKLTDPFQGDPTVADLIDHVQVEFPGFYDILLRDLLDGMKKIYSAYIIFLLSQIMLLIHTSTCCCGLYVDQKASG